MKPLPRGMVQERARVLLHRRIAADHYLLRIHSPRAARRAEPGQFIHILCGSCGGRSHRGHPHAPEQSCFGEAFPLLRRPLSLFDADPERGFIEVIYKVVGLGTASLARVPVGARVDFLGPLGRAFQLPKKAQTVFLVGGGVGIPPLYFLAKRIERRKGQIEVFLGARTRGWVICASDFRRLGVRVGVATDDGTWGWRGSVVDLLRRRLRARGVDGGTALSLCVCGPTPMMAAAAALARQARIPAQVSLEERMGCAMGCCMGCVVEVATEPVGSHARFQRVCTEGPVFDAREILWKSTNGH